METISISLKKGSKLEKPIVIQPNKTYSIVINSGEDPPDGNGWWLPVDVVNGAENTLPDQQFISMVELEDTLFRHRSAVFLPSIIDFQKQNNDSGSTQQCIAEGIDAIRSVLKHVRSYQPYKIPVLFAGHTDTSGDNEYNRKLSRMRSDAAAWVLIGDQSSRDKWVLQFKDYYRNEIRTKTDEDLQHILKWIASKRGWACDPGDIDGDIGGKTIIAIKAFQVSFNLDSEFSNSVKENGIADDLTWSAFFDVYQSELAKSCGLTIDKFNNVYRSGIDWNSLLFTMGCGENWPLDQAAKDNYKSQTNRRVEMLLMSPDSSLSDYSAYIPCLNGNCNKSQCKLYAPDYFGKARMTQFDENKEVSDTTWLLLYDPNGNPMENVDWYIDNNGEIHEGTSSDGWVELPQAIQCPSFCTVYWGSRDTLGRFEYHCEINRDCNEESLSEQDEATGKLNNLGYPSGFSLGTQVYLFQKDHGLSETGLTENGNVPVITMQKIRETYASLHAEH